MTSTAQQREPEVTLGKPFYFNTSAHLLRITAHKANSLTELLAGIKSCPEDSIFQHTFRTLQEHHFIREGYTNDFAHWTLTVCKEAALGSQLGEVDVRDFTSLRDLRDRFVQITESYLEKNAEAGSRPAPKAFYFCVSDIVVIPTTCVAHTMGEFIDCVKTVSVHSIHHHFIEARLRLKLMSNDFSEWLEQGVALPEPARQLNHIDIYTTTLEEARSQIVRILKKSVREISAL